MISTINTWNKFKANILAGKSTLIFNKGLNIDEIRLYKDFIDNNHIPDELLVILSDSNGQCYNSNPIFIEFRSKILTSDLIFYHYKFLSLKNIKEAYNFMQSYSKGKIDANLIPFAEINNVERNNGTTVFTIHNFDKTVHKTFCFTNDRGYVPIFEFRSDKFAKNLNEFLENQILWYSLMNNVSSC